MNIYELLNYYWNSAAKEPFSSSETALYFLLLKIANEQHWQEAFTCSTTTLCMLLGMSKQNVLKIRAHLIERGMINVQQGTGKRHISTYSFMLPICGEQSNGKQKGQLLSKLQLTPKLTLYKNNKKKDTTNNIIEETKVLKTLEELEAKLMGDTEWQKSVITALGDKDTGTAEYINSHITQFFLELKAKGTKQREEGDCKAHFFNWLKKRTNYNNHNYGNKQYATIQTQRRGLEVNARTAKDYEGKF